MFSFYCTTDVHPEIKTSTLCANILSRSEGIQYKEKIKNNKRENIVANNLWCAFSPFIPLLSIWVCARTLCLSTTLFHFTSPIRYYSTILFIISCLCSLSSCTFYRLLWAILFPFFAFDQNMEFHKQKECKRKCFLETQPRSLWNKKLKKSWN